MTMSSILLFRAPGGLISLRPSGFYTLPTGTSHTRSIVERISVHTVIFVITNVHLGNAANYTLDSGNEIREPLSEAINTIDTVLTFNVVTEADEMLILLLFQDAGEGIIAITIPGGVGLIYRTTFVLKQYSYRSPF
jgi:hypothetical protein